MPLGKTSPHVQACIRALEEYFAQNKDTSLVYISHGFYGEGYGWMDNLRKSIMHKYRSNVASNRKVVVGYLLWGCWNFFGAVKGKNCRLKEYTNAVIVHRAAIFR